MRLIYPDWPAPRTVSAVQTTREGGISLAPYGTLNLGLHVGDQPAAVLENRRRLNACLPAPPLWLEQVHGTEVFRLEPFTADLEPPAVPPVADAVVCTRPGQVCAIMTADCLPVLFCNRAGTVIGAAHAGWRGLLAGVLERTLEAMAVPGPEVMAWLGPAIGPDAFEVGEEVYAAFVQHHAESHLFFRPGNPSQPGKYWADLYGLAKLRLGHAGVVSVFGGGECTCTQSADYFSYRREGVTGRMASLIWLTG